MDNEQRSLYIKCANCGAVFDTRIRARNASIENSYFACEFCKCAVHVHGSIEELREKYPALSPPRDLRFSEVKLSTHILIELSRTVHNRELLGPVTSFASNMLRLQSMVEAPVIAIFLARISERCGQQALFELTGKVNEEAANDEEAQRLSTRSTEIMETWIAKREDNISAHVERLGAKGLQAMMTPGGPAFWLGLEATLIAQITGSWTAFEVLAGDLWEAALNAHPHTLADLKGRPPKGGDAVDHAQVDGKNRDDGKQIKISDLHRYGFDVSSRMGTILRQKRNFTILATIRQHYWEAFSDTCVCAHVEDASVRLLAETRNVFVHRAGAVDSKALGELSRHARLATLAVNDRIPIDGVLVQEIVNPVIETAANLIRSVDAWLTNNPQPSKKDD